MKTKVPMFFKKVFTWNFTEAGHGKRPMDGVGGAIKRRADEHVRHGSDITSARDFVNTFKESDIYIAEIPKADVMEMRRTVQITACLLYTSLCVCSVIRFLLSESVKPSEIFSRINKQYGKSCMKRAIFYAWVEKLKNGRTRMADEHRSLSLIHI